MNTVKLTSVNGCLILFVMIQTLTSCVYYEEPYPQTGFDGYDGKSYIRLNWSENEPDYIDVDNLVPSNFYWNTFYRTNPGLYTVYYEYDYYNGYSTITYAYEADIEVWVNRGEAGGVGYDGRDGADEYFDLGLYPDGTFDYYESARTKSLSMADTTLRMGAFDTLTVNGKTANMKVIYKRVEPRVHK